ncbi:trans-resveratrol di-O-methyltransferase-like [Rutidosis leptorrhynchoides]|uniref:trans-resveratrol di-O-methyltransferase-like n=1 Tax=Rutidosis leptorrhynchoides TaxID=125765 RepID=UPI003A9A16AE
MALQNDEQSKELLQAQAHVWNHIFSFINSMSLKCVIQLEIPDIINAHGGPMPLSKLIEALGVNPKRAECVRRLMNLLVNSGFFVIEREGYWLTPASRLLLKNDPLSMRPFLELQLDPMLMDPCHNLSKWFHNDDLTPFNTTYGKIFWEVAGLDPKFNTLFNEAMGCDAALVTSVIFKHCGSVFEGLKSIVDVGSGIGTLTRSIAKAYPNINCIAYDLPHVVNGLVGSKNLRFIGGDMFESIPKAEAVLLKWVFHNYDDERCIKILKKCKEVISSKENGGKLIIIDMVVENDKVGSKSLETQLFFDMLMMIHGIGIQRTEIEWSKLFADAGFSEYKIIPILGLRSLIEVYP